MVIFCAFISTPNEDHPTFILVLRASGFVLKVCFLFSRVPGLNATPPGEMSVPQVEADERHELFCGVNLVAGGPVATLRLLLVARPLPPGHEGAEQGQGVCDDTIPVPRQARCTDQGGGTLASRESHNSFEP